MAERDTRVFISYSRKDRQRVAKLSAALEAEDGIEVFRDTEDILPTEEWRARLEQLIGEADTIVFVLSPHSAVSEVCSWEIEHAESLNKRIAPIVIRDTAPEKIPKALTKYNYIFFTPKDDFDAALGNLVQALNTDIDWIREHTRLGEFARRWDQQRKLGAQPLRGRELAEAEDWLARQPEKAPPPTGLHREYITYSRRSATRRQQYWVAGSIAAAIVTTVLAGFAYVQKQAADALRTEAVEQRNIAVANEELAQKNERIAQENEKRANEERERAERNLEQALRAADTLVVEIAAGMKHFKGVPVERIRAVLEKAEAVLEGLENSGRTTAVQHRQAVMLSSLVEAYVTLGDLEQAAERARRSVEIMTSLIRQTPENRTWQRDLSVSYSLFGHVLHAQGDIGAALKSYAAARDIRVLLFEADPDNAEWQRDLAISHANIGNMHRTRGNLGAALTSYEASLEISERLAEVDAKNAIWQRDLAVTQNLIGNVHLVQGDLGAALRSYEAVLEISERLTESDPDNTDWQRDLEVSHEQIGNIHLAQGDLDAALKSYEAALEIAKRLAKSDPENARWQHDLATSHENIGDVRHDQGDFRQALKSYLVSVEISERLVSADPNNAGWQRSLAITYERIGDSLRARGDIETARDSYEFSLRIRKRLANTNPDNADWQRELAISHMRVGDVLRAQGNLDAALKSYETGLEIAERLAKTEPDNATWQRDLARSHRKLALHGAKPETHWQKVADILTALDAAGRLQPVDRKLLQSARENLQALQRDGGEDELQDETGRSEKNRKE